MTNYDNTEFLQIHVMASLLSNVLNSFVMNSLELSIVKPEPIEGNHSGHHKGHRQSAEPIKTKNKYM